MSSRERPWHGVTVATAVPFDSRLRVDFDAYAEHIDWLRANGCDGACPNGSLGEYPTLTDDERARLVETAVAAGGEGFTVMPGAAAYGSAQSRRWAEQAAEAGAQCVLLLPPNAYRADERSVLDHYRTVAEAGLPIVAYNNPIDTKVDLTPRLLARLYDEGLIVAVKEFTGDVRRAYEIGELAPGLDLLAGSDDVLLELALAGAVGWIAGYPNALPASTVRLWDLVTSGDRSGLDEALGIYRDLHSLLRWDSKTEFVQAIKLSMDIAGRHGGASRPPRLPLDAEQARTVTADTESALARGYR